MRCPTLSELPPPPSAQTGWPWTEETSQLSEQISNDLSLPKISITTPSYNQGNFIEKTIRSVLLQGYPNLEFIIIDGGSTDNTVEIIDKYEPWIAYWVSEPDRGQAHAINKGWEISQGEILHWLNSDDFLLPNAISFIAKEFSQDDEVQIVSGICSLTGSNGSEFATKLPREFNLEFFLKGGEAPGQPAVFLRSNLVKTVGKLKEDLNYTLDWEYWIRISQMCPGIETRQLQQALAVWYQWENCKSVEQEAKSYAERIRTLDGIFADPNIPERIKQLRGAAYGYVFSKQALALARIKQKKQAWQYSLRGLLHNPSLFSLKQAVKVIANIGY
jgi:glycosyltransferase involved in cell wall biosynthesis